MGDFETAVAQQVARAWALERALHARGPWGIRVELSDHVWIGSRTFPTERIIDETAQRVVFICPMWLHEVHAGEAVLELLCDGEEVSSRVMDLPAGDSVVEWELSIPQTATV